MSRFLTIALLLLSTYNSYSQNNRVLIIGIDGCRASVLSTASTPNMDNLMQSGYFTLDARTEAPTWSGVGWTAMMTGVWKDKHGVNDNSYIGQNLNYPHFFKRVNDQYPSLNKYSIVHWGPINTHLENFNSGEQRFTYGTDLEVENKAVDVLTNESPDVMFLHFDDVDHAGHSVGFLSSEPDYVSAIETADTRVGSVLSALYARPNYANENWLIIVSTDHGGNAAGHGGSSIEERTMFMLAAGDIDQFGEATIGETTYQATANALLDGTSGAYINTGDPSGDLVIGSNDFSVECWVKTNGWSSDPAIISNKNWNSGFNEGFILAGTTDGSSWKFNIGSGIVRYDLDGSSIDDGQWHHIAVTVDRDGEIIAYQDGIVTDQTSIIGAIDVDSDLDLNFGQDGTGNYNAGIAADISEVRIWNSVLSQNTLAEYMCSDLDANHPDHANLVGHWPLNDATGNTASNLAGTNHGTLMGNTTWNTSVSDRVCYDQSNIPQMVDIPYTALTHLCVDIDPAWGLEGQTFGIDECAITSMEELSKTSGIVALNGLLELSSNQPRTYRLYDSTGRLIMSKATSFLRYSVPSRGIFILTIEDEEIESNIKVVNP